MNSARESRERADELVAKFEQQLDSGLPQHWREAAREYHQQRSYRTLIVEPGQPQVRPPGAAATTIEALVYDIRSRGLAAVGDRSRRYRITELTQHQLAEVCRRLALRCPACPEGVQQEIIDQMAEVWRSTR